MFLNSPLPASTAGTPPTARETRLAAAAFHDSLDNILLETTKHRAMIVLRDAVHATRTRHYAPLEIFNTLLLACDTFAPRRSCRPLLFQSLTDIGKLFSLNLLPMTSSVAKQTCELIQRLGVRHYAATTTAHPPFDDGDRPLDLSMMMETSALGSSAFFSPSIGNVGQRAGSVSPQQPLPNRYDPATDTTFLVDDDELLMRLLQTLISLISSCALSSGALAELLSLLLIFYLGSEPGSLLEMTCAATFTQRTYAVCSALRDYGEHGEEGTPGSIAGQLNAVAYFKDLCHIAAGHTPRWLALSLPQPPSAAAGATGVDRERTTSALSVPSVGLSPRPARSPVKSAAHHSTTTTSASSTAVGAVGGENSLHASPAQPPVLSANNAHASGTQQPQQQQIPSLVIVPASSSSTLPVLGFPPFTTSANAASRGSVVAAATAAGATSCSTSSVMAAPPQQPSRKSFLTVGGGSGLLSPLHTSLRLSGAEPSVERGEAATGPAVWGDTAAAAGGGGALVSSSTAGEERVQLELQHRLRVMVMDVLINFFTESAPAVTTGSNAINGATVDGGTTRVARGGSGGGVPSSFAAERGESAFDGADGSSMPASHVNPLFLQCLNDDVLTLALQTPHLYAIPRLPRTGSGAALDGNTDGRSGRVGTDFGLLSSFILSSPPVDTLRTESGVFSPGDTGSAGSPLSPSHNQLQHDEAREMEERFILSQKLALVAVSYYAEFMRNSASELLLHHAMIVKECEVRTGLQGNPRAMLIVLALWRKVIARDTSRGSLLSFYLGGFGAADTPTRSGNKPRGAKASTMGEMVSTDNSDKGFSPAPLDLAEDSERGSSSSSNLGEPRSQLEQRAPEFSAFGTLVYETTQLLMELLAFANHGATTSCDAHRSPPPPPSSSSSSPYPLTSLPVPQPAERGTEGAGRNAGRQAQPPLSAMGPVAANATQPHPCAAYVGEVLSFLAMFAQSLARAAEEAIAGGGGGGGDSITSPFSFSSPTPFGVLPSSKDTLLPLPMARRTTSSNSLVSALRTGFLSLHPSLLRCYQQGMLGLTGDDLLHVVLKGVTHLVQVCCTLQLSEPRDGYLRSFFAALRREEAAVTHVVLAAATAAVTDAAATRAEALARHKTAAAAAARGARGSTSAGPFSAGGPDDSADDTAPPHGTPNPSSGGGAAATTAATTSSVAASSSGSRKWGGTWGLSMRKLTSALTGAGATASTSGATATTTTTTNTTNSAARAGDDASLLLQAGQFTSTTAGADIPGLHLLTSSSSSSTGPSGQRCILAAVEQLQQKLFILKSLASIANSMGESLGSGWAIVSEGFALTEPLIYRLQLCVHWITEEAVEEEQQQQLLSDAYHLRDALRLLCMENAQSLSDAAYESFVTSMVDAVATELTSVLRRYVALSSGSSTGAGTRSTTARKHNEENDDVNDAESGTAAVSGFPEDEAALLFGTKEAANGPLATAAAAALGFGCLNQWTLLTEGLCLAVVSLAPLRPERASRTWQQLQRLLSSVATMPRLRLWSAYLLECPSPLPGRVAGAAPRVVSPPHPSGGVAGNAAGGTLAMTGGAGGGGGLNASKDGSHPSTQQQQQRGAKPTATHAGSATTERLPSGNAGGFGTSGNAAGATNAAGAAVSSMAATGGATSGGGGSSSGGAPSAGGAAGDTVPAVDVALSELDESLALVAEHVAVVGGYLCTFWNAPSTSAATAGFGVGSGYRSSGYHHHSGRSATGGGGGGGGLSSSTSTSPKPAPTLPSELTTGPFVQARLARLAAKLLPCCDAFAHPLYPAGASTGGKSARHGHSGRSSPAGGGKGSTAPGSTSPTSTTVANAAALAARVTSTTPLPSWPFALLTELYASLLLPSPEATQYEPNTISLTTSPRQPPPPAGAGGAAKGGGNASGGPGASASTPSSAFANSAAMVWSSTSPPTGLASFGAMDRRTAGEKLTLSLEVSTETAALISNALATLCLSSANATLRETLKLIQGYGEDIRGPAWEPILKLLQCTAIAVSQPALLARYRTERRGSGSGGGGDGAAGTGNRPAEESPQRYRTSPALLSSSPSTTIGGSAPSSAAGLAGTTSSGNPASKANTTTSHTKLSSSSPPPSSDSSSPLPRINTASLEANASSTAMVVLPTSFMTPAYASECVSYAFRALETIQHNCITSMEEEGLRQLMLCAGAFVTHHVVGAEETRLHLNLSAVQMLWSIADYLASTPILPSGSADAGGGGGGGAVEVGALAMSGSGSLGSNLTATGSPRDELWCALLLQLADGGFDERQEVRQSAQKTLFALVQTYGGQFSADCWRCVLLSIIVPLMEVVLEAQEACAIAPPPPPPPSTTTVSKAPPAQSKPAAASRAPLASPSMSPLRTRLGSTASLVSHGYPSPASFAALGGGGGGQQQQPLLLLPSPQSQLHIRTISGPSTSVAELRPGAGGRGGAEADESNYGASSSGLYVEEQQRHAAARAALLAVFESQPKQLDEARITLMDAGSRSFLSHYLSMQYTLCGGTAAGAHGDHGGPPYTTATATSAAASAASQGQALLDDVLAFFVEFCGESAVVLRGMTGEEVAMSAIHALHGLLVEMPGGLPPAHVELAWRALERLLLRDELTAHTAAKQCTTAVVAALLAALCDHFCMYRAASMAMMTMTPDAQQQALSLRARRRSSAAGSGVASAFAPGGPLGEADITVQAQDSPHGRGIGQAPECPPHAFTRLLTVMQRSASCPATVESYYFPSKSQLTLLEGLYTVWPCLAPQEAVSVVELVVLPQLPAAAQLRAFVTQDMGVARSASVSATPSTSPQPAPSAAAGAAATASTGATASTSTATARADNPAGTVSSIATASSSSSLPAATTATAPAKAMLSLKSVLPPAAHPTVMLLFLDFMQYALSGVRHLPQDGRGGGDASVEGGEVVVVVHLPSEEVLRATLPASIRCAEGLLQLQYASPASLAVSSPGPPFTLPPTFFSHCTAVLQFIVHHILLRVRSASSPAGAANDATHGAVPGDVRHDGVVAIKDGFAQLVHLATSAVRSCDARAVKEPGGRTPCVEDKDTASAAAAATTKTTAASIPAYLQPAISTLESLVSQLMGESMRALVDDLDDAESASELIAPVVEASSIDLPALAGLAERCLRVLQRWTLSASPSIASPLTPHDADDHGSAAALSPSSSTEAAATQHTLASTAAPYAASDGVQSRRSTPKPSITLPQHQQQQQPEARAKISDVVRASLHARNKTVMEQYLADPQNPHAAAMLRSTLRSLLTLCTRGAVRGEGGAHRFERESAATAGSGSGLSEEEEENLRTILPDLALLVSCVDPRPTRSADDIAQEQELRMLLSKTLISIYVALNIA